MLVYLAIKASNAYLAAMEILFFGLKLIAAGLATIFLAGAGS